MEEAKSTNHNPKQLRVKKRKPSIAEIKKALGLDRVIHKPINVKKDNKHLYYVTGFVYPLRWQTLERLNIPNQRIICEIDRDEWIEELKEAKEKESPKDPWDE